MSPNLGKMKFRPTTDLITTAGRPALPIDKILADLKQRLSLNRNVVLQAPPGAGKSTVVPLDLLTSPWLGEQKILLLEPRRLAARSVARRMAQTLNQPVGRTIGYRMRLERKVSAATRVEVITEGILTRQIQSDPDLKGIGCIIFDEFHERSLQADLALALCLDVQNALREDLRLLVMSATLDAAAVAKMLGNAPVITSEGRQFPVDTHYLTPQQSPTHSLVTTITQAVAKHAGNALVFLPGVAEIRQTETALHPQVDSNILIAPLYGGLDNAAQDLAIQPPPEGQRKVVLATNIAETSLTIEGVTIVIDSGLERRTEFDPRKGMTQLVKRPISVASADQRRGRAGRLGPGHCYRLWSQSEQQQRPRHSQAEIIQADLCALVLELAQWGVSNPSTLTWLDEPPSAAVAQAQSLLIALGALDPRHRITEHGKIMAQLGLHPRLAHMLILANALRSGALACTIAALLSERNPFHDSDSHSDFALRLKLFEQGAKTTHRGALTRIKKQADQFRRQLGIAADDASLPAGVLLAWAYPDRIAQRRPGQDARYKLSNGGGAFLSHPGNLGNEKYLVVTELDGQRREARIFSAIALDEPDIEQYLHSFCSTTEEIFWDRKTEAVTAEIQNQLGSLVLFRRALPKPDPRQIQSVLLQGIRQQGLRCLPWTEACRELQARCQYLSNVKDQDFPDFSDQRLFHTLEQWLSPWLTGLSRLSHLTRLDIESILLARLSWQQQRQLNDAVPTHFQVPSGSRIRLKYLDHAMPVLSVRVQEVFSTSRHPSILNGRQPLQVQLLSPAHHPIQITTDLPGFWNGSYAEVKKDLKGRYPKHHWPDDPANTPAHRGYTKRRLQKL